MALPVDSFSHAEYTSDTSVSVYFNATRSGKDASIKVVLTVSSGKANDVIASLVNQVATGTAPVMKFDDVKDSFYTKSVSGVSSFTTTEGPAQLIPSGGAEGEFLRKVSSTDYDVEWEDVHTQFVDVRNDSGGTLTKGTPVHATGVTGENADVIAARADTASAMPATYVLNEDIADGETGEAIISGLITGINTNAFNPGDVIYVAATGGFTNVKPTGTNLIQNLGVVTKSNQNTGSGVILGSGRSNDVPNIPDGQAWIGNSSGVATPTTLADVATSGSYNDLSNRPSIPVSGVDFDPAGTDNSTDVTLDVTSHDYLSIGQGQEITLEAIDWNDDITNKPTIDSAAIKNNNGTPELDGSITQAELQSAIGVDAAGTDNSTDVTLVTTSHDYLSISNQAITLGSVDYVDDVTNKPTIPSGDVADDTTPQLGGDLDVNGNKIVSASNGDIIIDPHGTGKIVLQADEIRTRGTGSVGVGIIKLYEGDILDDDNFVALQAPISLASDLTFTLPSTDGSDGQVLKTNGSGTLSFTDSLDGVNDTLTGVTQIKDAGTTRGTVSFYDDAGDNFVALRGATTIDSDTVFILPTADGSADEFLKTDGSGNLSFANPTAKFRQVHSMSFIDDIGTVYHYLPWKDINEQTTIYQEEAAMLMPYDGRIVSVSVRTATLSGSGDLTLRVYTAPTGTNIFAPGSFTEKENETLAVTSTDDHHTFHFVFDNAQHFEAGDLCSIGINASADLSSTTYWYVTTVVEFDTATDLGSSSTEHESNP